MINYRKNICFVLTTELTVKAFLLNHLRALSETYNITLIVNAENINFLNVFGINAKVVPLAIERKIDLISDINCLIKLIMIFRKHDFSAVHSVTPKAGLLAMLAAWFTCVPLRIHTFTGQVWATKKGFNRYIFKKFDCIIAALTTNNLIDSSSQRDFLMQEHVVTAKKAIVLGTGSISGVDIARFKPCFSTRENIRVQLNIKSKDVLFLFLGRLTIDKGVLDLANAFNQLNNDNVHLLFVGPDEHGMRTRIINALGIDNTKISFIGHTDTPEVYMAAADVLCLPSYREGFGTVVIEAAAVGIPTVASNIYGLRDAVVDGETGLLHEVRNIEAIKTCLKLMTINKPQRIKLGEQARERAINQFDSNKITQLWVDFYNEHLNLQ